MMVDDKNKQINELAADIYSMSRSDAMSRAMASMLYDKGWHKHKKDKGISTPFVVKDTVEVVRCKDCTQCYHNPSLGTYRCGRFMAVVDPNHFCSCGERNSNESKVKNNI